MAKSSAGPKVAKKETKASPPAEGDAPLPLPPPRVARRHGGPGRQPSLSVDAIVEAAIEVIDASGSAGLTMRRVAEHLGTGAATLYAHVSGRDEILELVYDALLGQVPLEVPDPAAWRSQLHRMLRGLRDILAAHSDAALAGLGRVPTSPRSLAGAEVLAGVLRAGGLSNGVIALALDQLMLYVSACALELGLYRGGAADAGELARYFAGVHAFYVALPRSRFPVLADVAPDMIGHDADERFAFGLDVLIEGFLAAEAASS